MTTMTKTRLRDIPQLFALYRTAFPRSERKPFGIILRMAREGRADLWTIRHRGRFAGLAATVNGPDIVLLDYFAVKRSLRGRGVGSALIRAALEELEKRGYEAVFLVPAEPSLFGYYERFGFRAVSTIREQTIEAATPLPLRKLTADEYTAARRTLLPKASLLQEGPCLALLSGYADFYATDRAVAAVSGDMVWELLGEISDAPGLIAALGLPTATVRTPGPGRPFAMALGTDGPMYLGLALD